MLQFVISSLYQTRRDNTRRTALWWPFSVALANKPIKWIMFLSNQFLDKHAQNEFLILSLGIGVGVVSTKRVLWWSPRNFEFSIGSKIHISGRKFSLSDGSILNCSNRIGVSPIKSITRNSHQIENLYQIRTKRCSWSHHILNGFPRLHSSNHHRC